MNYLYIAACLAGLAQARSRGRLLDPSPFLRLPCVGPVRMGVYFAAMTLVFLTSGPILLAASFGAWFLDLRWFFS